MRRPDLDRILARGRSVGDPLLVVWQRFSEVGGIERAMVLASQAFVAFIPFLVLIVALVPGGDADQIGERIVARFGLTGGVADSVEQLFAPAGSVATQTTVLSVLLLVFSGYTFSRRVQGLYELVWRLPRATLHQAWRPLGWLLVLTAYLGVIPAIQSLGHGHRVVLAAASFGLWLVTPAFLLAGRVAWRRLVPTALLTATGMTAMSAGSTIYMSRAIASSTDQFGPIGAAFAVISWLLGVALVIVLAAVLGVLYVERVRPGSTVAPTRCAERG